jgi:hypothetical protein
VSFWDLLWGLVVFFFWFMFIWIFIQIFADIFRRRDLSGGWKVVWLVVLVFLPFLGALIYILSRKQTPQDVEDMEAAKEQMRKMSGYSAADEIAKLEQLRASGALSQEEFNAAKAKALGS